MDASKIRRAPKPKTRPPLNPNGGLSVFISKLFPLWRSKGCAEPRMWAERSANQGSAQATWVFRDDLHHSDGHSARHCGSPEKILRSSRIEHPTGTDYVSPKTCPFSSLGRGKVYTHFDSTLVAKPIASVLRDSFFSAAFVRRVPDRFYRADEASLRQLSSPYRRENLHPWPTCAL